MFGLSSREDILYQAMELCGDQFIDWERSECKFDSPEFIRLLEFISQFPAKIDEAGMQEDTETQARSIWTHASRSCMGRSAESRRVGSFGTQP